MDGWTIETWTNAATPPTSPSRCYPSNRIPVVGTTGNTRCQCPVYFRLLSQIMDHTDEGAWCITHSQNYCRDGNVIMHPEQDFPCAPTSPSRCYPSNKIPVVGTTGNTRCQVPRVLPSPQPDHWHWWGSLMHHPQPELLQRWERHHAPWTRLSLCSSQGIGLIPGVLESPSRPPGCQDTSSWGRSQYKPSRPPVSFGRREQWLPGPARLLFPSAGVEYFTPRDSKSHRSMSSSRWLLTLVTAWCRIILLFVSLWNACKSWPSVYSWRSSWAIRFDACMQYLHSLSNTFNIGKWGMGWHREASIGVPGSLCGKRIWPVRAALSPLSHRGLPSCLL